jgi:outer membrane protein assembly factor BamE (lipoprotein component of BamABCDE complex)
MKLVMSKTRVTLISSLMLALLLAGCQTVAQHKAGVQDDSTDRMTVGKVQKEIRVGMSGADVAQALGSPNIVSTDEERREVWIYDKIATDRAYSSSSGGVNALILGFGGGIAGGGVGSNSSAGASSTSQRTLTVIIKFDKESKVRDFAYHTSRF